MRITARALLIAALCASAGCARGDRPPAGDAAGAAASDTIDAARRDSLLGESALPGARGVKAAREAADRIEKRRARLDSISE
ncbi:MAG: hypothetical protein ACE5HF_06710 [Gemmatimonadota bacterium]